jgi:hypothetical protein
MAQQKRTLAAGRVLSERPAPDPILPARLRVGFGPRVILRPYQYWENRLSHRPFRHPAAGAAVWLFWYGPTGTAPTTRPVLLVHVSGGNSEESEAGPHSPE